MKLKTIMESNLMSDKELDLEINSGGIMNVSQTPSNYFVIEYKGTKISLTTEQAKKLARFLGSRY